MGMSHLVDRPDLQRVAVRIDSMTAVHDVRRGTGGPGAVSAYREPIREWLAGIPTHDWRHLADDDPNPADALAAVGADIARLDPGE